MNYRIKGPNVNIWGNPEIGDNTEIAAMVEIGKGVKIGKNCKIEAGALLFMGLMLEDFVFVGPGVVFTNDKYPVAMGNWKVKNTLVKSGASIGANATILPGITIGKKAMIGAGAVVTKDVPDGETWVGNPARKL